MELRLPPPMDEDQLDPEQGREVAAQLRKLGVQGILITAAELGHISELSCTMPICHCPEELGGKGHFINVPEALPEWIPTVDHIQPSSCLSRKPRSFAHAIDQSVAEIWGLDEGELEA